MNNLKRITSINSKDLYLNFLSIPLWKQISELTELLLLNNLGFWYWSKLLCCFLSGVCSHWSVSLPNLEHLPVIFFKSSFMKWILWASVVEVLRRSEITNSVCFFGRIACPIVPSPPKLVNPPLDYLFQTKDTENTWDLLKFPACSHVRKLGGVFCTQVRMRLPSA